MSQFYLTSNNSSSSSLSSIDNLPYPAPLSRPDFLVSSFNPSHYLSTLRSRHQTLEDLRSELRARSQLLSQELLDLVNGNYQDFLGLGASLKGGEESVEGVRVGLLGLQREVEGVKKGVAERRREVAEGLEERRKVRGEMLVARGLLEVDEHLGELEEGLAVGSSPARKTSEEEEESEDDSEDDDDEDGDEVAWTMSLAKLRRHVRGYLLIRQLCEKIGAQHPFLIQQESRMMRVRNTILLDLGAALKQARMAGDAGKGRVMRIVGLYGEMDEAAEAVKALKSMKVS
ncbi:hypothetical protein K402DRAFT_463467 [Aulographum hederae CBS 113979]|uniref:Conserved oligomeric Golgi complex subunit 2 n=1 Tax=Aulographum hederae CBS 113979 TaxID=1176131 RepID=A0A6G1H0I3_9PEZI|nr:hypothetical protein K402DRAFT_463467 [Aulographum hederae CBS 113979]